MSDLRAETPSIKVYVLKDESWQIKYMKTKRFY
ncbi:hypothetical protein JAMGFMIE_00096 [Rheinheimera sp. MM224]|nr:hypothetical protein JAMGFMIE_00096 [Rheinheimera sp. MM224]